MLDQIPWVFNEKKYNSKLDFENEIQQYQEKINNKEWVPEKILIERPKINIQYEAWIKDKDELLDNEEILDGEDIFDEEAEEDGYYQLEILATLEADNGKNFSASELLMKTHNQLSNKFLGDHIFFEGFEILEEDEIPTLLLTCGS